LPGFGRTGKTRKQASGFRTFAIITTDANELLGQIGLDIAKPVFQVHCVDASPTATTGSAALSLRITAGQKITPQD
jgi:hypothetical protein